MPSDSSIPTAADTGHSLFDTEHGQDLSSNATVARLLSGPGQETPKLISGQRLMLSLEGYCPTACLLSPQGELWLHKSIWISTEMTQLPLSAEEPDQAHDTEAQR